MDPTQLTEIVGQADARLASTTPNQEIQAALAQNRPDLWAALASNPMLYPELVNWLYQLQDDAVLAALNGQRTYSSPPGADGAAQTPAAWAWAADGAPPQGVAAAERSSHWSPVPLIAAAVIILLVIGGIGTWRLGLFGGDDNRTPSTAAGGHGSDRASSASHRKDREGDKDRDGKDSKKDEETDRGEPTPAEEEPDRDSPAPAESSKPGSGASDSNGAGAAGYVTPCARAPQFTVRSVSDQDGELEVTTEVTPSCAEGDVLTGAANSIMLYAPSSTTGGSGAADMVVAYADFDFSGAPVVIPSGGRTLVLRFAAGYFFRSASDISAGSTTISGDIDRSGASNAVAVGSDASTTAIAASGTGDGQTAEAAAAGNLRWQADHDRPTIVSSVSGYWVPQVSSKRLGLYAEGMTWGSPAIVQEFFSLRQQFPQALLLFSDDWSVFDAGGGWWVTIVGIPFTTAEEANAWCDSQGLDGEHCFAKYIDTNGSSEGTTRNR